MARGESAEAKAESDALLELARNLQDEALLVEAHHLAGIVASHSGDFIGARNHFAESINRYQPNQKHSTVFLFTAGEGLVTRASLAHTTRLLGYPDLARRLADETRALAAKSSYPISRGIVLIASASISRDFEGPQGLLELAEELITLANDFQTNQAPWGTFLRGWARADLGDQEGIDEMRNSLIEQAKTGSRMLGPSYNLLFAATLLKAGLVDEAETTMNEVLELASKINERVSLAEMYRVMGELMVARSEQPNPPFTSINKGRQDAGENADLLGQAENWFCRALETARSQNAKLWELLAATSLSRLYRKQDKKEDARRVLSDVYKWFTEGFDTDSLRDAKALLDELQ